MADLYSNVIAEMEDLGVPFFSVYLDTAHSMLVLDVPPEFTGCTGWPGCADCGIVTSSTTMNESPVRFERTGAVAKSVGDGWEKFLRANNIGKGKFVVFEPVDKRCLVAAIYPRPGTPEFSKTLRSSHFGKKNSAKLVRPPLYHYVLVLPCLYANLRFFKRWNDIPTRFWRRYGSDKFDQRAFTLRGPECSVTVTAVRKRRANQMTCYFTSGWDRFREQNALGVGDTIVFTEVGNAHFLVTKL